MLVYLKNKNFFIRLKALLAIGLLFSILTFSENATAAPPPPSCTQATLEEVVQCCTTLPGYFYQTYDCIHNILRVTTKTNIERAVNLLRDAIGTTMVLAVVLLGIRFMVKGQKEIEERKVETKVLAFKFAVIGFLLLSDLTNIEYYTNAIKSISLEIASSVTVAVSKTPADPAGITNIWTLLDKTAVGFITGIPNIMEVSASHLMLLGVVVVGLIFSGPLGVVIFTFILSTLMSMFVAFAICIMVHFTALIAITFLMCLTPLFLPLVIFNPQTIPRTIFDKWVFSLISYSVQPLMVTVFLALMITVLDSFIGKLVSDIVNIPPGILPPPGYKLSWWKIIDSGAPGIFIGIPYPDLGWPTSKIVTVLFDIFLILMISMALLEFARSVPNIAGRLVEGGVPNIASGGAIGRSLGKASESMNKFSGKMFEKAPGFISSTTSAAMKSRSSKKRD